MYRKKNSPYWFVQFIDSNGKRRNKSTELRTDNPGETTQARALRAQFEAKELMRTGAVEGDGWDTWVPQFLERYCETARTRERYIDAWKWLALWLQLRKLHTPRAITPGCPSGNRSIGGARRLVWMQLRLPSMQPIVATTQRMNKPGVNSGAPVILESLLRLQV